MNNTRCAGCGEPIHKGAKTVEILMGSFAEGPKPLTESERWGIMHRSCFNKSIDSPDAALEEIRRLAEEA